MNFDRTVIAHEQREKFFAKNKHKHVDAEFLVWCMCDGKVHGACVYLMWLGPDSVVDGPHAGKVWWPQNEHL